MFALYFVDRWLRDLGEPQAVGVKVGSFPSEQSGRAAAGAFTLWAWYRYGSGELVLLRRDGTLAAGPWAVEEAPAPAA